MSVRDFTEEELMKLSDEERAALEDDEDQEEEIEEEEDSDDDEVEEESTTDDDSPDDEADDGEQEEGGDDSDEQDAPEFEPRYKPESVADYDDKMAALDDQKKDLRKRFNYGDIDIEEYESERDQIEKSARELHDAKLKSDIATEQAQQSSQQKWEWTQEQFFSKKENQIYKDSEILGSAFNTAVKALGSDEANKDRSMSWFLEEANRQVRALMGQQPTQTGDQDKSKSKPGKKAKTAEIPPNLGDMPAADQADVGKEDEFAHLDKLSGTALERELAKLGPEAERRYLQG
jgi:hypothetical protein